MATSETSIANLALQKLGADRITSLDQNHPNAREMNAAYSAMRDLELRSYRWNFAKKRAALTAHATSPASDSGFAYAYPLPSDYLRLLAANESNLYDGDNSVDWKIEQHEGVRCILTNWSNMDIVYIAQITDPAQFDAAFVELLACRLALQCCERLTQSNTKRQLSQCEYDDARRNARHVNAFENIPTRSLEDSWYTVRKTGVWGRN